MRRFMFLMFKRTATNHMPHFPTAHPLYKFINTHNTTPLHIPVYYKHHTKLPTPTPTPPIPVINFKML